MKRESTGRVDLDGALCRELGADLAAPSVCVWTWLVVMPMIRSVRQRA
ncbi:MAG: hypothetical protein VX690_02365 [Pseudomonadota bacterium]|nr:hypothetical protein [Pseudomonadota bacterium]